jgi:hypothetical protein
LLFFGLTAKNFLPNLNFEKFNFYYLREENRLQSLTQFFFIVNFSFLSVNIKHCRSNICYNFFNIFRYEEEKTSRATGFRLDSQTDRAAEPKNRTGQTRRKGSSRTPQSETQKTGKARRIKKFQPTSDTH